MNDWKEVCPYRGKLFGGCRFEPRYDLGPGAYPPVEFSNDEYLHEMMKEARAKTYVQDICVRCGEIRTRESKP